MESLNLQSKYQNLSLSVCGSGTELASAQMYVKENDIANVVFHGNLSGSKLVEQFVCSDVYILPTYEEGMATSVLESMAFGLPIISRPVGGVKDFFVNDEMGVLTESLDPRVYADIIEEYINNPQKVKHISNVNYNFAKGNFYASKVVKKFENDINLYCKK